MIFAYYIFGIHMNIATTLYRLFISGMLDCLYFYVSFIVAVEKSPNTNVHFAQSNVES